MQTDLITKVYFNEHLTHSCVGMPQGLQALLSSFLLVQRLPKSIKIFATIKSIKFIIFSLSLVIDTYSLCSTEHFLYAFPAFPHSTLSWSTILGPNIPPKGLTIT